LAIMTPGRSGNVLPKSRKDREFTNRN
jgi:hypothetical protein